MGHGSGWWVSWKPEFLHQKNHTNSSQRCHCYQHQTNNPYSALHEVKTAHTRCYSCFLRLQKHHSSCGRKTKPHHNSHVRLWLYVKKRKTHSSTCKSPGCHFLLTLKLEIKIWRDSLSDIWSHVNKCLWKTRFITSFLYKAAWYRAGSASYAKSATELLIHQKSTRIDLTLGSRNVSVRTLTAPAQRFLYERW